MVQKKTEEIMTVGCVKCDFLLALYRYSNSELRCAIAPVRHRTLKICHMSANNHTHDLLKMHPWACHSVLA